MTNSIDTKPLLNELNNIINASIENKISDLVKRNNLLEETHEKLVNLPSVQKFFDTKNGCNDCKCANNDNSMLLSLIEEKINANFINTNVLLNKLVSEINELKNEINNLKYSEKENIRLEIEEVVCEQITPHLEEEIEEEVEEVEEVEELEEVEEVEELEEVEEVEEVEEELEEEVEEVEELEEEEEEIEEEIEELENDIKSIETEAKEDEDEELIEIEIDDITYCTNDEDNGIIYELDKDGNVGKKIGYLKDGEAYFD